MDTSLKFHLIAYILVAMQTASVWATGIGNAYLEAKTQDMISVIAGPKFGELEIYGLRTSGLHWENDSPAEAYP